MSTEKRKELNIQIGERIQIARGLAGLTQERFSELVGVSTQYISDLERGVTGTSIPTLIKICKTLSVSSDYILMGEKSDKDISGILRRLEYLPENEIKLIERGINLMIEAFQSREQ